MISTLIIDDEPLARAVIKEYLQCHSNIKVVQECADGFEGLKAIQQHQPQLIFLDVQMPKISGFEMLELLDAPPAVIFTTAFDAYAIKAFDAHAIDYLLKPFSQERFNRSVEKMLQRSPVTTEETVHSAVAMLKELPLQQQRVVVKTGGKIKIIPFTQIQYLEAADDYVKIVTHEGSFLKSKTMGYFESVLPAAQFVRTHRSYILNVQEITRIEPYEKESHVAILKCGAQTPVSKMGYGRLRQVLGL